MEYNRQSFISYINVLILIFLVIMAIEFLESSKKLEELRQEIRSQGDEIHDIRHDFFNQFSSFEEKLPTHKITKKMIGK